MNYRDTAAADVMRYFIRHGISGGLTNTRFCIVSQLRENLISTFGKPDREEPMILGGIREIKSLSLHIVASAGKEVTLGEEVRRALPVIRFSRSVSLPDDTPSAGITCDRHPRHQDHKEILYEHLFRQGPAPGKADSGSSSGQSILQWQRQRPESWLP